MLVNYNISDLWKLKLIILIIIHPLRICICENWLGDESRISIMVIRQRVLLQLLTSIVWTFAKAILKVAVLLWDASLQLLLTLNIWKIQRLFALDGAQALIWIILTAWWVRLLIILVNSCDVGGPSLSLDLSVRLELRPSNISHVLIFWIGVATVVFAFVIIFYSLSPGLILALASLLLQLSLQIISFFVKQL